MTNTNRNQPKREASKATETTLETGDYVSERGTKFEIVPKTNGLYTVQMLKGGAVPPICNSSFTSLRLAKEALEDYIKTTDRNGYAQYPSKETKVNAKS